MWGAQRRGPKWQGSCVNAVLGQHCLQRAHARPLSCSLRTPSSAWGALPFVQRTSGCLSTGLPSLKSVP